MSKGAAHSFQEKKVELTLGVFQRNSFVWEALARVEKENRRVMEKPFISLLGADLKRVELTRRLYEIEKAFDDPAQHMRFEIFQGLKKKDVFRIYSLFPRFIVPATALPDCEEESEELNQVADFYLSSGLWLLNWEKNGQYSSLLKSLKPKEAEERAWVSRNLYALCDYMSAHSESPYIKPLSPAVIWLLCEISVCKNRLQDRYREGSKRKRYDRMQKIYARLDSMDPEKVLPTRAADDLPDLATHFYGYFMHLVKQMAVDRPDFDQVLFKQYLQSAKVWGRKAVSAKGAIAYL